MDRDAAASWLGRRALVPAQERIFLAPGAHGAMVGIFSLLARAGDTVLCEAITYPGVRSICAQLGLQLIGVDMDGDGVIPEALEGAVRRHAPKAIYLNPTLQNPMTITIPERRRAAICSLARRFQIQIVEDDALWFHSNARPPAPRGHRARHLLAHCGPRQVHRRWPAFGLCRRAGRPSRVVVQQRDARALRDGVADLRGGRDAMDQRWHRRHDPAIHSIREHRQRAHRREGARAGHVPFRSAELQHLVADAQRLDPLGLRKPGADKWPLASLQATPLPRTAPPPRPCASDWGDRLRALRSSAASRSCRICSKDSRNPSRHSGAFGARMASMTGHVLVVDQGTTSTRSIVFGPGAALVAMAQEEFPQIFPQDGWVEHDPESLWRTTLSTARQALSRAGVEPSALAALGITNQRETTLVWSRTTGRPIYNAIVWQDRRTAPLCAELKARGSETLVSERTGLLLDPYFSATKIAWILDNVPGARAEAERGDLAFGTVDSFLVWRLTNGKVHVTDATNASRTLLFNIHTGLWDDDLLALFRVPRAMLAEVKDCAAEFGEAAAEYLGATIPIRGIAGDQQAALIGQACFRRGHGEVDLRNGMFRARQHRRQGGHVHTQIADDDRLPVQEQTHLCARRVDLLGGRDRAMVARRPRHPRQRPGSGRIGGERGPPTRGLFGAGVHRPWRAPLGQRGPRRDLWLDARRDRARRSCAPRSKASAIRRVT